VFVALLLVVILAAFPRQKSTRPKYEGPWECSVVVGDEKKTNDLYTLSGTLRLTLRATKSLGIYVGDSGSNNLATSWLVNVPRIRIDELEPGIRKWSLMVYPNPTDKDPAAQKHFVREFVLSSGATNAEMKILSAGEEFTLKGHDYWDWIFHFTKSKG